MPNPVFLSEFPGVFTYAKDSPNVAEKFAAKYPAISPHWWTLIDTIAEDDGNGGLIFGPRMGLGAMSRENGIDFASLNGFNTPDWPNEFNGILSADLPALPSGKWSAVMIHRCNPAATGNVLPWGLHFNANATPVSIISRPYSTTTPRLSFVDSIAGTDSETGSTNPVLTGATKGAVVLEMACIDFASDDYWMSLDGGQTFAAGTMNNLSLANANVFKVVIGKGPQTGGNTFYGQIPDVMIFEGDITQMANFRADLRAYADAAWGWVG